jgi:ubiquinone/menaquinone biosynthesis C-methylase UbiE
MERSFAEYLLEKTKGNYNLIADTFSRARSTLWREMKFLVDDFVKPGEKILDLGCGNGRLYETLKEKKVDYIGVDFSEKLIEIAKRRFPETKFQAADAINLPFPNNFFDKIYSTAVLHHIPSEEFRLQFLKEARRVLKPEGLLILTVWNLWQKAKIKKLIFKFTLSRIFGKSKLDFNDILLDWAGIKNCYFHCFTKNEFKKLITEAGFDIIECGEFTVGSEREKYPKLPNLNFYIVARK